MCLRLCCRRRYSPNPTPTLARHTLCTGGDKFCFSVLHSTPDCIARLTSFIENSFRKSWPWRFTNSSMLWMFYFDFNCFLVYWYPWSPAFFLLNSFLLLLHFLCLLSSVQTGLSFKNSTIGDRDQCERDMESRQRAAQEAEGWITPNLFDTSPLIFLRLGLLCAFTPLIKLFCFDKILTEPGRD